LRSFKKRFLRFDYTYATTGKVFLLSVVRLEAENFVCLIFSDLLLLERELINCALLASYPSPSSILTLLTKGMGGFSRIDEELPEFDETNLLIAIL
jgi:hypothetical protein